VVGDRELSNENMNFILQLLENLVFYFAYSHCHLIFLALNS
jgi:hypothetical protein